MTPITVYEKDRCSACTNTKRKLDEVGIPYVVKDATEPGNAAAIAELNYKQAPVVVAGDEHWSGFRPDKIEELLKRLDAEEGK